MSKDTPPRPPYPAYIPGSDPFDVNGRQVMCDVVAGSCPGTCRRRAWVDPVSAGKLMKLLSNNAPGVNAIMLDNRIQRFADALQQVGQTPTQECANLAPKD